MFAWRLLNTLASWVTHPQVMTFELWHPFATAMERAVLLRDL